MKRVLQWLSYILLFLITVLFLAYGVAQFYKKEILTAVNQVLKKSINGEVNIGDVDFTIFEDFPAVTFTLKDIYMRGPKYTTYHKEFFSAKELRLSARLGPLIAKQIMIRSVRVVDGNVFIFRTLSGYSNTDIFKSNKPKDSIKSQKPLSISFGKIKLENVAFSYQDSLKKKAYGFYFTKLENSISQTDSSYLFAMSGPMKFGELTLNPAKGSYLKDIHANVHLNLEFVPQSSTLNIQPSVLGFPKSDVNLSGNFKLAAPGSFLLQIHSDKLDFAEGVSIVTKAIASKLEKISIEKTVRLDTKINGTLAPGAEPAVDVDFEFIDSKTGMPPLKVEHLTLHGAFSNHVDSTKVNDDHNSSVIIKNFDGIIEGIPTKLTASLYELKDPYLEVKSAVDLNLTSINSHLDTTNMKFTKGSFSSRIEYAGKLSEYLNPTNTTYEGKLKGSATVKDASFHYLSRKQHYENVNLSVNFTANELAVDTFSFALNNSPVRLAGKMVGWVPFLTQPGTKSYASLQIYSPHFDASSLVSKKVVKKKSRQNSSEKRKKIAKFIYALENKIEFDLALQIDTITFHNLKAKNLKGNISFANNALKTKNLSMILAGGKMDFYIGLQKISEPSSPLTLTAKVSHADISQFLYAFNNFNQSLVTDKNLDGKINMNLSFAASIDDDFSILTPSMKGNTNLSINKGKLENFAPLQKMGDFLFKKRSFDSIAFDEIKTNFALHSTEIDISKMEIASNVIRVFLEGRYSFKDSTDLSVQIPLSNLKKHDKNYKPENVGVDAKVGPSVFLHVYKGKDGKTSIAYDPFKKHAGKKR